MSFKLKENKLPQVIENIAKAEVKALTAMALYVQARASERTPVDTGRLRASISYSVDGSTVQSNPMAKSQEDTQVGTQKGFAIVGTNVEYARRIEYGFSGQDSLGRTYNQPKQPFLRPAVDDNLTTIKRIARNEFAKGILK